MDREMAEGLASLMRQGTGGNGLFVLDEERQTPLVGFHSWANGKQCVGAFLIRQMQDSTRFWFLFIDHGENGNFYLHLYPENRSGPKLELHKIENSDGKNFLVWTYSPSFNDGKNHEDADEGKRITKENNAERKSRFEKLAGNTEQKIALPNDNRKLDNFIGDIFLLACNRLKADDLKITLSGNVPGDQFTPTKDDMQRSLNTILYGPPGTGKTYATTRRCVEICDGQAERSNEAVSRRYRELAEAGRVEFITFHQSYGYEEFVEGLRPDTGLGGSAEGKEERKEENGAGLRLIPTDGVLKRIAKHARSREAGSASTSIDLTGRQVFKLALGNPQESGEHDDIFEACIESGWALLGSWGRGEVDLSDPRFESEDEIFVRLQEIVPEITKRDGMYQSLHYFRCEMRAGDLVVVPDGLTHFRAVGKITGKYEFVTGNEYAYCHRRDVEWLWWDRQSKPISGFYSGTLARGAIHRLRPEKIRRDSLRRYIDSAIEPTRKPHVLVIDEINRANVSKVLGELVTLLEEDKRAGAENEVAVTLPHSGDRFTLPPNLHILGTMNTADRSIALLDTALRRRFEFEELAPEPDALQDAKDATGIDLPEVLRVMNERLEWLLGRDHLIGHAWLMKARTKEDVDGIMRHKIIPLIAEYFYDNWEKVRAVLGGSDDFVEGRPLDPPPGLDDTDENRQRWSVRKEFNEGAYVRLVKGSAAPAPGTGDAE